MQYDRLSQQQLGFLCDYYSMFNIQ